MMDELSTGSSDYASNSWIAWFLSTKGNEYFCEVDEDYILDRFNLTGLNAEVQHYPQALDLVTDALEEDLDDEIRDHIEAQARLLYGLVHARYIVTTRGLAKMLEKYKRADFGRCPRVLCYQQPLLPLGLSDVAFQKAVKLFCPRCEDIYSPKSSRHGTIDGAFFGTTFPHMLFMVYPHMLPSKSPTAQSPFLLSPGNGAPVGGGGGGGFGVGGGAGATASAAQRGGGGGGAGAVHDGAHVGAAGRTGDGASTTAGGGGGGGGGAGSSGGGGGGGGGGVGVGSTTANAAAKVERYRPRIFGFPTHETAQLHRWQERERDTQVERLERGEQLAYLQQHALQQQRRWDATAAAAAAGGKTVAGLGGGGGSGGVGGSGGQHASHSTAGGGAAAATTTPPPNSTTSGMSAATAAAAVAAAAAAATQGRGSMASGGGAVGGGGGGGTLPVDTRANLAAGGRLSGLD